MKEVDYQKFVLDIAREAGGAGHKLSNRFLIGVSDLLIKLPGREAALIEVKLAKFAPTTKPDHEFDLGVTVLQREFLKKYHKAGMRVGVLSFVEHGRQKLWADVFGLDSFNEAGYLIRQIANHVPLCWTERRIEIRDMLEDFTRWPTT